MLIGYVYQKTSGPGGQLLQYFLQGSVFQILSYFDHGDDIKVFFDVEIADVCLNHPNVGKPSAQVTDEILVDVKSGHVVALFQ